MPRALVLAPLALVLTLPAAAQSGFGKLDPTPPSGISTDAIVTKMGAQEAAFEAARNGYEFRQADAQPWRVA